MKRPLTCKDTPKEMVREKEARREERREREKKREREDFHSFSKEGVNGFEK